VLGLFIASFFEGVSLSPILQVDALGLTFIHAENVTVFSEKITKSLAKLMPMSNF